MSRLLRDVIDSVPPLARHGGERKRKRQGSLTTLKPERGADYLAARIKRDHPDIAAKIPVRIGDRKPPAPDWQLPPLVVNPRPPVLVPA